MERAFWENLDVRLGTARQKNKALFQEPLVSICGLYIGGQLLPAVLKPENPKIDYQQEGFFSGRFFLNGFLLVFPYRDFQ